MDIVFILNTASTLFLCGLIWVIQLLHYPFFHRLDRENFNDHLHTHKRRISFLVVPAMLIELGSSFWLAVQSSLYQAEFIIGFMFVLLIWMSTFFIQVPLHRKISDSYSKKSVTYLVATNWIRTSLWSFKSLLNLYIMYLMFSSIMY